MRIPESELIINNRGAVYHLNLRPEEIADTIITVGDPARVQEVSKYFDNIEYKSQAREFISNTGFIGNKRLTVISTGIGTDNIDIVLNELDALVNIDLINRTVKPQLTILNIIRVGTSGSLQEDVPVDHFVASTHGLGIDNLLNFYRQDQNEEDKQLIHSFITQTQLHNTLTHPYINSCSPTLIKNFVKDFNHGITITCPGFYGPQGRTIRLGLRHPDLVSQFSKFSFGNHRIINFEMETSAIYGLGKILGHHCLSLSTVVANRVAKEFSNNPQQAMDKLIVRTLETISSL